MGSGEVQRPNQAAYDLATADSTSLEEKEAEIDKNLRNRKTKFSVTGEVEFSGHDIKVGVYYERQAKTKKREWLIYGEVDRVQLSGFFGSLNGSRFDYVLENVALIAASQDYKDTQDINLKGYKVQQGLSLWATIKPPEQITGLSNDPPPFSSVKLEVRYHQRHFTVQVEMPPEFAIDILKTHSRLEKFSVGLEIGSDPKLMLGVVLKTVLTGQKDLLEIEGMIKAGTVDAVGSLTFGLTAEIDIDGTMVRGGMVLSETEGEMFQIAVKNIDMCKIIHFAGRLANIDSLQQLADVPNRRGKEGVHDQMKYLFQDEENRLRGEKAGYDDQLTQLYGVMEAAFESWLGSKKEAQSRLDEARRNLEYWENRWNRAGFFDRLGMLPMVDKAKVELALAETNLSLIRFNVVSELAIVGFKDTKEYKDLMEAINNVTKALESAANALTTLNNQGIEGFIKAAVANEDEKVQAARRRLDLLLSNNSEQQKAVREAQADLDHKGPDILRRIQEHKNEISRLKDKGDRRVAWFDYENTKEQYNKLKSTVDTMNNILEEIRPAFHEGIQVIKDKVVVWRKFFLNITRIEVKASINAINAQKLILISITAEYEGKLRTFSVEWTPSLKFKLSDLYKLIADDAKKNFLPT